MIHGYYDQIEFEEGTNPLDPFSKPVDTDGDSIPDSTDEDDDNDGVPDTTDAFPLDSNEQQENSQTGGGVFFARDLLVFGLLVLMLALRRKVICTPI